MGMPHDSFFHPRPTADIDAYAVCGKVFRSFVLNWLCKVSVELQYIVAIEAYEKACGADIHIVRMFCLCRIYKPYSFTVRDLRQAVDCLSKVTKVRET